MSPKTKTTDLLRKKGYIAQSVEKYNAFTHRRNDLFGFIDIVAVHPDGVGTVGIQVTAGGNSSSRIEKILSIKEHKLWLSAGNRIWVLDWVKKGKSGKRKLWRVNATEIKYTGHCLKLLLD